MCIRDSCWNVFEKFQSLLNSQIKNFINIFLFIFYSQRFFCLLYTSDAADERSSVDLGGRRIIKKKNIDQNIVYRSHQINKKQTKYSTY